MTAEHPAPKRLGRPGGPERRAAILEAAVELFSQRGYRATGLHALADEVGITHSGILHHFNSKETLLHAVIDYRFEQEAADYVQILAAGGRAGIELLPRIAERLLENPKLQRLFTVLIAENLNADDPLHDHFVNTQRVGRRFVATMVRAGIDRGEFRPDVDAELVATELIAFVVGMQNQWLLDPEDVRLVETYQRYTSDLVSRLVPPPRQRRS
jgi:AcrR family transcriptional regulator